MTPFLTDHVGRILDIIPETSNPVILNAFVEADVVFNAALRCLLLIVEASMRWTIRRLRPGSQADTQHYVY